MKIAHSVVNYARSLEELKGRNDADAFKSVAKEMEALFAYELIKAMRAAASSSSKDGFGKNFHMSMFDIEIARLFAERGLGIQAMLLRGLERAGATGNAGEMHRDGEHKTEGTSGQQDADSTQFRLPVTGVVSSGFGIRRHPVYGGYKFHQGIDIAAAEGANIYPVRSGSVVFSGEQHGYGNLVVIDHGDGFVTKYGHNKVNLVKEGDAVDRNTVIALVGSTGVSTGAHLHFEVKHRGEYVNPMKLISKAY